MSQAERLHKKPTELACGDMALKAGHVNYGLLGAKHAIIVQPGVSPIKVKTTI